MDTNAMLLVGLAVNFVTMVIGGLGLLFAVWRYSMANTARMAVMETNIHHLMHAQGLKVRRGENDNAIHG